MPERQKGVYCVITKLGREKFIIASALYENDLSKNLKEYNLDRLLDMI